MVDFMKVSSDLAWPVTLLIAWLLGEYLHRWVNLPRISLYALVGFTVASSQVGFLPKTPPSSLLLLANIAFGLILFECGYRINLRWLLRNPWIGVTSLVESAFTFGAVYVMVRGFGLESSIASLLAALSMATSPATVIRVINEQRSSGQVTERVLHLSALNCVLAVFVFKIIVGLLVFRTSGNLWQATYNSLIILLISVALGAFFGFIMPMLLRSIKHTSHDSTLAFSIAIILVVTLTHNLKLSPVLATLTLGLVSRHRRIVFSPSQRGFGVLGDLLSMLLFVFIATTLEWRHVLEGTVLGFLIIFVRQVAKIAGICIFAHISGITQRKGLLLGMAMAPLSVFVILVLEQIRYLGINFVDRLAALAMAALTLEVIGPILVQRALIWAHEVSEIKES